MKIVLLFPVFIPFIPWFYFILFFIKILFLYLSERERESAPKKGDWQAEGEAGFPQSKEPDVGLDPRTLES